MEKSETDYKQYRVINLDNGLRAVLISDLKPDELESGCSSGSEDESASECDRSESETDEDGGSEDVIDDQEVPRTATSQQRIPPRGQRSAAALCVNVGSFSDPVEVQGLAHFLEHMVFMGSEKYPEENDFDAYIASRGGSSNAWTDSEHTMFYFEVRRRHLKEALDQFANFFIAPLLSQSSMDREVTAVHSEYQMATSNDYVRVEYLLGTLSKPGSPYRIFQAGNKKSLLEIPAERGVDIYSYLQTFRKQMYSADLMTVAVQSRESLDDVESLVREIFASVPKSSVPRPALKQISEPFDTLEFKKFYKVASVKDFNKLRLVWGLPSQQKEYRSHPLKILAYLVGHEGQGSIISHLRRKNLAVSLTAGSFEQTSHAALFMIEIELTEEGCEQMDHVTLLAFSYLAMLRRSGVPERVFTEYCQMRANEFRFKEEQEPIQTVGTLAHNMHLFDQAHLLSGEEVVHEFRPDIYTFLLGLMTADRANVMFVSRRHEAECNLLEPWFGTQYAVEDISTVAMDRWLNAQPMDVFHLPNQNKFIATNFDLLSVDDVTEWPRNLNDASENKEKKAFGDLWYTKEKQFRVPKGHVVFHLWSPLGESTIENCVLHEMLIYALTQNLCEVAYEAEEASLEYKLTALSGGIVIDLSGFNDKLFLLFSTIIDYLKAFTIDKEKFANYKEIFRQTYTNSIYKPEKLGMHLMRHLIQDKYYFSVDKIRHLENLTLEHLTGFHAAYLVELRINAYIHGNIAAQEAMRYFDYCRDQLRFRPLPEIIQKRLAIVPPGERRIRVMNINPWDVNTSLANYFQLGEGTLRLEALNQLLAFILSEPCFNFLRTKETLGYAVALEHRHVNGVLGLVVFVLSQADKFPTDHCHTKMDEFLLEMSAGIVEQLSDQAYATFVSSLIATKQLTDVNMGMVVERNWKEIETGAFVFNRRQRLVEILRGITKQDLLQFFRSHYLDSRKKLSVEVDAVANRGDRVDSTFEKTFQLNLQTMRCGETCHQATYVDFRQFRQELGYFPAHRIVE